MDVKVPLVVSLSFSFYYEDSTTVPKLELYQILKNSQKDKAFKLRSQLTCTYMRKVPDLLIHFISYRYNLCGTTMATLEWR